MLYVAGGIIGIALLCSFLLACYVVVVALMSPAQIASPSSSVVQVPLVQTEHTTIEVVYRSCSASSQTLAREFTQSVQQFIAHNAHALGMLRTFIAKHDDNCERRIHAEP